jgi:hypothetical protein
MASLCPSGEALQADWGRSCVLYACKVVPWGSLLGPSTEATSVGPAAYEMGKWQHHSRGTPLAVPESLCGRSRRPRPERPGARGEGGAPLLSSPLLPGPGPESALVSLVGPAGRDLPFGETPPSQVAAPARPLLPPEVTWDLSLGVSPWAVGRRLQRLKRELGTVRDSGAGQRKTELGRRRRRKERGGGRGAGSGAPQVSGARDAWEGDLGTT